MNKLFNFSTHKAFCYTIMYREVLCTAKLIVLIDYVKSPLQLWTSCSLSYSWSYSKGTQIITMTGLYLHVVLCHSLQTFTLVTEGIINEWIEINLSLSCSIYLFDFALSFIFQTGATKNPVKSLPSLFCTNTTHCLIQSICAFKSKMYFSNTAWICLVYQCDISTASRIYLNSWRYMINKSKSVQCFGLFTEGDSSYTSVY